MQPSNVSIIPLSLPFSDKAGWPWTEEAPKSSTDMSDATRWPRLSIVTPSYNQAPYLEETIRSVLLQGYPDLEYIIIDGGSTDGSVEIIRKYEPWLACWVSERDAGQSDALNKGFRRATGEIVAWLNSDDTYLPGVLAARVQHLISAPGAALVYGDCYFVDEAGRRIGAWQTSQCTAASLLMDDNLIPQQSVLMRADALARVGYINPRLHYTMDYELWCRLSCVGELLYVPGPVANFRHHTVSKSVADGYKFALETLDWVAQWPDLGQILGSTEQTELRRRLHVKAALEFLIADRAQEAAAHLRTAFSDDVWPFGDPDTLAMRLVDAQTLSGRSLHESWQQTLALRSLLEAVLSRRRARLLWRRAASRYHMRRVFQVDPGMDPAALRQSLVQGIWHDPRWLRNRGVWSIGLQALAGRARSLRDANGPQNRRHTELERK